MKHNKKILKIKNKKAILENVDTYDSLTDMTVGTVSDVAKFAKSSTKFFAGMSKFLGKTSWYTFRAKILKNMSQEDYESALKSVRIDFVSDSDEAVREIDSNVTQMLSRAGIPESEVNSYLLGFPGYNIIENINASNLLTGRAFSKKQYTDIDPINKDTIEMIIVFMFVEIYPKYRNASKITDSLMTQIANEEFYRKNINELKTRVRNFLSNTRKINLDIIEKIKQTKSQKVLDFLRKGVKTQLDGKNHYTKIAKDKDKANEFLNNLKNKLSEFKLNESTINQSNFSRPLLNISNKKINLIKEFKEDIEIDTWNAEFINLIRSISVSILHLDNEISDIVIEDFKEETKAELSSLKKELDLDKDAENQESKLGFLEKFVCNMGFEAYYFSAELVFLERLPGQDSINPGSFKDYLTQAYKSVLKDDVEVFEPLKEAITEFIENRANNKFTSILPDEIDQAKQDANDKIGQASLNYRDEEAAKRLIEQERDLKIKILLYRFIKEYYDGIKTEFESQNLFDDIVNYAKTAISDDNPKFNKAYAPDNIVRILQGLSKFDKTKIESEFSTFATKISDEESRLEDALQTLETNLESYKNPPAGSSTSSGSATSGSSTSSGSATSGSSTSSSSGSTASSS